MFEKHVQYRWHVFGTLRAFARRDNFFVSDASTGRRTSTRWRSKPIDGFMICIFQNHLSHFVYWSCKSHAAYCSIKKSYLGRIGRSTRRYTSWYEFEWWCGLKVTGQFQQTPLPSIMEYHWSQGSMVASHFSLLRPCKFGWCMAHAPRTETARTKWRAAFYMLNTYHFGRLPLE